MRLEGGRRWTKPAAAAVLAAVFCLGGCYVDEQGRFPPPTFNLLGPAPSWIGVPYEDVVLTNSHGQPVYAWWIPADGAKLTVLIHHGAVSNRSGMHGQYTILHGLGYNVMVYDYQGFGENWNTPSLDTILPDADAVLTYLQQCDRPGAERVVIYGISLGTLPAIAQSAACHDRVVGMIVEGSFVPAELPPWSLLLGGMVPWINVMSQLPIELDPLQYIEHVTMPKLFLQSQTDHITPFSSAQQLFDLSPEPKTFVTVNGPHVAAWEADPNWATILQTFLDGLPDAPTSE